MSRSIHILSDEAASLIAAGEVIDRPNAVVRELVDNAVDAHAAAITVRLESGGIEKITVIDNGDGIDRDDLPFLFIKHATSKINSIGDLQKLKSMGFRGEALYSIQTVCKTRITTSTDPEGLTPGHQMIRKPDGTIEITPVPCKKGTRIEAESIFYNIPARKKFLKSNTSELGQIKKTLIEKALAWRDIRFTLMNDDKTLFETDGKGSLESVFFSIYKQENRFPIYQLDKTISPSLRITVFYSPMDIWFSDRKYQACYVNQRPVSISFFYSALDQGIRSYISPGRHPLFYCFIEIDPGLIDVNIHPAKKEIRFYDQSQIFTAITQSAGESMSRSVKDHSTLAPFISQINPEPVKTQTVYSMQTPLFHEDSRKDSSDHQGYFQEVIETAGTASVILQTEQQTDYRIIGCFFNTYILVETGERLLMIDQHAAAESIILRKKKEKLANITLIDKLLIPAVIAVSHWNDTTERKIEDLNRNGFRIEITDNQTITVYEIPSILLLSRDYQIASDVINEYLSDNTDKLNDLTGWILIESSCKEAVKKGDRLSLLEMGEIVKEYFDYGITHCPHGRPAHFEISVSDLDKIFQRKK